MATMAWASTVHQPAFVSFLLTSPSLLTPRIEGWSIHFSFHSFTCSPCIARVWQVRASRSYLHHQLHSLRPPAQTVLFSTTRRWEKVGSTGSFSCRGGLFLIFSSMACISPCSAMAGTARCVTTKRVYPICPLTRIPGDERQTSWVEHPHLVGLDLSWCRSRPCARWWSHSRANVAQHYPCC